MPIIDKHNPGDFCWYELATTDPEAASVFYRGLFGWEIAKFPMGPEEFYYMPKIHGKDVAGMYKLTDREAGMPPSWKLYVHSGSADASAAKVKAAGGTVIVEPFDVMTFGRMFVFQDPAGAFLNVWQPMSHQGALVVGEPGTFCWGELVTRDTAKAKDFYASVFGWGTKVGPVDGYTEYMNGGRPVGGMMPIDPAWGDVPPHWAGYVMVADCDATAEKAKGLGASVMLGPRDIPNVGRFALIKDPQGAMFYVIKLTAIG